MKILLVPYDLQGLALNYEDVREADLILQERESGDFEAMKWCDGNSEDVKVKVAE